MGSAGGTECSTVKSPSISKLPTVLPASVTRFANGTPIRSSSTAVRTNNNNARGAALATTRRSLWEYVWEYVVVAIAPPFWSRAHTNPWRGFSKNGTGFVNYPRIFRAVIIVLVRSIPKAFVVPFRCARGSEGGPACRADLNRSQDSPFATTGAACARPGKNLTLENTTQLPR